MQVNQDPGSHHTGLLSLFFFILFLQLFEFTEGIQGDNCHIQKSAHDYTKFQIKEKLFLNRSF